MLSLLVGGFVFVCSRAGSCLQGSGHRLGLLDFDLPALLEGFQTLVTRQQIRPQLIARGSGKPREALRLIRYLVVPFFFFFSPGAADLGRGVQ